MGFTVGFGVEVGGAKSFVVRAEVRVLASG